MHVNALYRETITARTVLKLKCIWTFWKAVLYGNELIFLPNAIAKKIDFRYVTQRFTVLSCLFRLRRPPVLLVHSSGCRGGDGGAGCHGDSGQRGAVLPDGAHHPTDAQAGLQLARGRASGLGLPQAVHSDRHYLVSGIHRLLHTGRSIYLPPSPHIFMPVRLWTSLSSSH